MLMYNLLDYGQNYSVTLRNLLNYYRDEVNDFFNENNDKKNYRIDNSKTIPSKSFVYKTKILGRIRDDNNLLDADVSVPIKYLENFPICHCLTVK